MKTYYKHQSNTRGFTPRYILQVGMKPLKVLFALCSWLLALPFKLLPHRLLRRLNPTQRLFFNVILTSIFLVFGVWIYTAFINPQQSEAAWFNHSWLYRQTVPITNDGTEQTQFQVLVTLDTATLITEGKMRADCADVRFVSQTGKILPYFQTTACDATKTRYWIKVNKIPVGSSTIYIYYGNSSAQSASNRDAVFDLSLMGNFSQQYSNASIAQNHGAASDRENNFYISNSTIVNRFNTSWVYQQQYGTLDLYTGICYDDKLDVFYGIDWSSKQWSAFSTSFVEQAPMDQTLGNQPIDCATDSTYIYTNHRSGLIGRNAIADNSSSTINMDTLSGFNWGGQGLTYAFGYLFAGTTASYGDNGNRIYMIDVSDWANPEIVTSWSSAGHTLTEVAGLTWMGKYIYQTDRGSDYANAWTGPVKTAATEPVVGSTTNEEQSEGPVGYWKFDEGQGTVVNDSTANKSYGNISDATWKPQDDCMAGKCLFFTGTNTVTIPEQSNNPLDFGTGDFTISTWIKTGTSADHRNLIRKGAGAGLSGFRFGLSAGRPNVLIGDTDNFTSGNLGSTSIADNAWHHLVVVFDRESNAIAYVDGTQIGTLDISGVSGSIDNTSSVVIGNSYATFTGFLDEVRMYPYARSNTQIQAEFNARGSVRGTNISIGESQNATLSNGLVGYWKMDTPTASFVDSSGNEQATTVTGSATSSGKFGTALDLDGTSSDYTVITDANSVDFTTQFTVSTWVYRDTDSGGLERIISKDNASTATSYYWYLQLDSADKIQFGNAEGGNNYGTATTSLGTGRWYHIVGVYDGTQPNAADRIKIYVNGVSNKASDFGTHPTTLVANTGNINFGRLYSGGYQYGFNGKLDETRLYNSALSPAEVQQLYVFAPPPIYYAPLDEGTGTTVKDISGSNYSGSFVGTPSWTEGKFGKALKFDQAVSEYVSTSTLTGPLNAINNHTVGFWAKFTNVSDGSYRKLFGINPSGTDRSPGVWTFATAGTLQLHWRINPSNSGFTNLGTTGNGGTHFETNKWYYIAVSKEETKGTAYVNGVNVGSTTVSDPMTIGTGSLILGGGAGIIMDEVKVYNYARSQKQITEDMNGGHPAGGSPVGSQIGYWKLDEGYGTLTHDSSPQRVDGTINNAVWSQNGKFGKSLQFGGGQYVTLGNISAYKIATRSATFWANPSSNLAATVGVISASGSNWYVGFSSSNRMIVSYQNAANSQTTSFSSVNAAIPNEWHYYGYTMEAVGADVTLKFYRDGKLITTNQILGGGIGVSFGSNFILGSFTTSSNFYDGLLDEVKLYNAVLTDEEIKLDYNKGSSLVLGSGSTDSSGLASNSASRLYCIPGDTSTCLPPVGEWDFEEKNDSTTNDTSGNNYTGTLGSQVSWTRGKIGSAISTNTSGINSSVTAGDNLDLIGSPLSISVWVYPRANTNLAGIVDKLSSGGNYRIIQTGTSGLIQFGIRDSVSAYESLNSTTALPLNQWSHIYITYDNSTTGKIYINGKLDATKTNFTLTRGDIATHLRFGYSTNNAISFDGAMDQVRIYDYVRTASQVAWDYNRGGPVAKWKMDECQGSTINDASGNGLEGTITIGATGTQTSAGTCQTASTAWGNGVTGKFNSSLNFDGTDDYANMGQPAALQLTGSLSISAWIKTSETDQGGIVSKWYNTNGNRGYRFYINNGTLSFNASSDGTAQSTISHAGSYNTGSWVFVTAVYDATAGTAKLYKNGTLVNTSSSFPNSIFNTSRDFNIGTSDANTTGANTLTGQMDDIQIFNYALTPVQVRNLMNQGGAVRFGPATGSP